MIALHLNAKGFLIFTGSLLVQRKTPSILYWEIVPQLTFIPQQQRPGFGAAETELCMQAWVKAGADVDCIQNNHFGSSVTCYVKPRSGSRHG